jgi:hypothetical protein
MTAEKFVVRPLVLVGEFWFVLGTKLVTVLPIIVALESFSFTQKSVARNASKWWLEK